MVTGDSGVGKTNLVSRFHRDHFHLESKATIGVEFATQNLMMPNGHVIRAQIWDTAGQERYRALTRAYYRGALGGLIVFDVSQRNTFENAEKWIKEMREYADPSAPLVLVGNKSDLSHLRQVSVAEAESFAEDKRLLGYVEASALDATNVYVAFEKLVNAVHSIVTHDDDSTSTVDSRPHGPTHASTAKGLAIRGLALHGVNATGRARRGTCAC